MRPTLFALKFAFEIAPQRSINSFVPRPTEKQCAIGSYTSGTINRWTPACTKAENSILARGRQIIQAYDDVYKGYESYAVRTLRVSKMIYRQLPFHLP